MSEEFNPNSIDATLARIEANINTAMAALVDQNRRVTALETAENKRTGALLAIGTVASAIGAGAVMLFDFFKGK